MTTKTCETHDTYYDERGERCKNCHVYVGENFLKTNKTRRAEAREREEKKIADTAVAAKHAGRQSVKEKNEGE